MSRLEMWHGPLDRALDLPREPFGLDEAMLRRLERALHRLEPDPLFRRRLRGEVVNRYVAAREGLLVQPRRRRSMGKLGRAVLYASLMLAISVSAAGAAAQDSLPGDVLYGVKLQLEEIRLRIAPPSIHDDLAAMALAERIDELEALAAAGTWQLIPAAAARVTRAEMALIAARDEAAQEAEAAQLAEAAQQALDVLEAVLSRAPETARQGLERALQVVAADPALADKPAAGRPEPSGNQASATPPSRSPRPDPAADPDRPKPRSETRGAP